jgi:hypothetical protein
MDPDRNYLNATYQMSEWHVWTLILSLNFILNLKYGLYLE